MSGNEPTELRPIPRLLVSMSWLKAPWLRRGGQGWENVLVTEVFQGLDFLPRSDFLGGVIREGKGSDDVRSLLASEAEGAVLTLLPPSTWLEPADGVNAVEVQPDARIESPSVVCLVEAKRIKPGKFQPEQLARSYLAVLQEARQRRRRPLLLLVIPSEPPVPVEGHGSMAVRDGVEHLLPTVFERLGRDPVGIGAMADAIDSTVAWVTWPQIEKVVKTARRKRRPGDTSGLAALDRVAGAVLDAIHFHGVDPFIALGAEPICTTCRHFDVRSMDGDLACAAFPDLIPAPILENQVDHRQPYKGDGGLRWEQDRGAPPLNVALYEELFDRARENPA